MDERYSYLGLLIRVFYDVCFVAFGGYNVTFQKHVEQRFRFVSEVPQHSATMKKTCVAMLRA